MKRLWLGVLLALLAAGGARAQVTAAFGADVTATVAGDGAGLGAGGALVLGGYLFREEWRVGVFTPLDVAFRVGDDGSGGTAALVRAGFGAGGGMQFALNEEQAVRVGLAPELFVRMDTAAASAVGVLLGVCADASYSFEPFADDAVSKILTLGVRAAFAFVEFGGNRRQVLVTPYAGVSLRFNRVTTDYVVSGPGY